MGGCTGWVYGGTQCQLQLTPIIPHPLPTGTPALTTRNMKEADMDKVAKFIHEGIQIAVDANTTLAAQAGSKGKAATNSKVMASILTQCHAYRKYTGSP